MCQKIYYVDVQKKQRNTAGKKAPDDIAEICKRQNMVPVTMPIFPSHKSKLFLKMWRQFIITPIWSKLCRSVNSGDVVIYQHPMYGKRITMKFIQKIQEKKDGKCIALIHDLESLRKGIEGVISENREENEIADGVLLKQFDAVICHNEHMRQYMISQGFLEDRLVNLDIFDYICDYKGVRREKGGTPSISIAGNLAIGKSRYIYDIVDRKENRDLILHLYGNNFDESNIQEGMFYHGSFLPEDLPSHLEGDFGLVWDGLSAETCAGNTGEYLKYNNPHKASLYLASGMPIIVWSKAAIADFVLEHGVGIVTDSLINLKDEIIKVSEEEYRTMCDNVSEVGEKVRSGFYFINALGKCLAIVGNE